MATETIAIARHLHSKMKLTGEAVKILKRRNASERVDLFLLPEVVTIEQTAGGDPFLEIRNCQNRRNPRGRERLEDDVIRRPDLALTPGLGHDPGQGTNVAEKKP